MNKETQDSAAKEASDISLNQNTSSQNDYVVIGYIAEATNAAGLTLITVNGEGNPFDSVEVMSTRFFSEGDIGKKVACMPIAGSDRMMLMGFMPEDEAVTRSPPPTILDELLGATPNSQNQDDASYISSEEESNYPEEQNNDPRVFDRAVEPSDEANNVIVIADGKEAEHLLLRAETAITIQAGESSITLNSDGRVRINGRYINSRASHTQRISGGAVKIN